MEDGSGLSRGLCTLSIDTWHEQQTQRARNAQIHQPQRYGVLKQAGAARNLTK
jgi:hypothetical protein